MSKIDYQVLREAAVAIETVATPQKLLAFRMKVTPQVVLALLDELEAAEKRIAELEAKLDSADKLQDSAFRHGLQHGFSLGQTDNQAGFEECLSAYGTGKGE
ncbi:ead/Ea22-like family protein [Escherichia coli]|nr:ead/Ea22-like family protein [Escherichia coli]